MSGPNGAKEPAPGSCCDVSQERGFVWVELGLQVGSVWVRFRGATAFSVAQGAFFGFVSSSFFVAFATFVACAAAFATLEAFAVAFATLVAFGVGGNGEC